MYAQVGVYCYLLLVLLDPPPLPHGYASGSVDLLVINSHYLRTLISVIAIRTAACLGYSAAANQRQHCDGTGGPFNQQKLKIVPTNKFISNVTITLRIAIKSQ